MWVSRSTPGGAAGEPPVRIRLPSLILPLLPFETLIRNAINIEADSMDG